MIDSSREGSSSEAISSVSRLFYEIYLRAQYRRKLGNWPSLRSPTCVHEKILYRKLRGNHEFCASLADKLAVRDYVQQRIGAEHLVPLIATFNHLEPDSFERLPRQFAMKATHGCNWNLFVRDKAQLDVPKTISYFNGLLRRTYGRKSGELHYRLIPPRIMVEQLLDENGTSPWNYCYFCYWNGDTFQSALSISSPCKTLSVSFDPEMHVLESNVPENDLARFADPEGHRKMTEIARELSRGIDFVRVDLYKFDGKIYFSELTLTPGAGTVPIVNPVRQALRDRMWHLDRNNPLLYR
jgi:hypothetical protein